MLWKLDARDLLPLDSHSPQLCPRVSAAPGAGAVAGAHLSLPVCERFYSCCWSFYLWTNSSAAPRPLYVPRCICIRTLVLVFTQTQKQLQTHADDELPCKQCASFFVFEDDELHERFSVSAQQSGFKLASFRGAPFPFLRLPFLSNVSSRKSTLYSTCAAFNDSHSLLTRYLSNCTTNCTRSILYMYTKLITLTL